ncbi:hypothetical protein MNBD_GAMMA22-2502 [hydrothermal vent metagenome]|uniref:DUF4153 domain-containing protein n=1 Tax=hydrothermal vent metagenome TaxID=652676 RepID=A0A3B0ZXZ4_9ZZZZ
MLLGFKNSLNILPAVKFTVLRFPFASISAFCATLVLLGLVHDFNFLSNDNSFRLFIALLYSSLALTSLKLFVEARKWSLAKHSSVAIIVLLVISYFSWFILFKHEKIIIIFFSLVIALSLSFVPYINKSSSTSSFWFFNYETGVAISYALVASIVLGAGLSVILVSIEYLFDINMPSKIFVDTWLLTWGVFFPIYFLSNISKEFDFQEELCDFPRGISFITNYIFVPLMWAYMAILYAYFAKIIFQWELPRGNLGSVIIAFGTIGVLTKILSYPIRNNGTRLLMIFDRYFYYALIVPIILLAIAISIRIYDYGITESRYAVVLLGVWLAIIIAMTAIKKDRFHIKYIPMLFALLAFFASFGPWGAVSMSLNSQLSRFEATMQKHNLLVNGQAVKFQGKLLSFSERKHLSSLADYLMKNDYRLSHIKPFFKTLVTNSGAAQLTSSSYGGSRKIFDLMGIEHVNYWQKSDNLQRFNYKGDLNEINSNLVGIKNYDFIGQFSSYFKIRHLKTRTYHFRYDNVLQSIKISQNESKIIVQLEQGEALVFDIAQVVKKLQAQNVITITNDNIAGLTLIEKNANNSEVKLLLTRINGHVSDDKTIKIKNVNYLLMLRIK